MNQHSTVHSNEESMANGNNGGSTLPVVTPQVVEELEMGLISQA